MNVLKKNWLFGAIALVFTSCSNDEIIHPNPQVKTPIRLSSSVSLLKSVSQNVQIAAGQKVGFYLNITDEAEFSIINELLTADGSGNFAHESMYYPTEGASFEFTAYHPHSEDGLKDGYVEFNIEADQSEKADYLNSDLLYSNKKDVERTLNAVPLAFNHKLSKLTFTIKKGEGAEISDLSKIEILDILTFVKMDIADGTLTAASGASATINAFGVENGANGVEALSGSAAIIVPQTIEENSKLLRITIGEKTYAYTTTEAQTFESGKVYDFEIEIGSFGVTVTSSIKNWDTGDSTTGDGILE